MPELKKDTKVKIKSFKELNDPKKHPMFTPIREKYCGLVAVITEISEQKISDDVSDYLYKIDLDNGLHTWTADLFEDITNAKN